MKLALEFVQPMPLMIWAAMLLEVVEAIMEDPVYWLDVGVLIVLQLLNVVVGFYEELQVRGVCLCVCVCLCVRPHTPPRRCAFLHVSAALTS